MRGVYNIVQTSVSSGTAAVTLSEFTVSSSTIAQVRRAWVSNLTDEGSQQWDIRLCRQSTAGTNVTTPTVEALDPGMASSGLTVRGMCTTQGTVTSTVVPDGFNVLQNWVWVAASQDEYILVPPSGIFSLRLAAGNGTSIPISVGLTVAIIG